MNRVTEVAWDLDDPKVREDLRLFPLAVESGWEARTNGPVINGLPHSPIKYVRGTTTLWNSSVLHWPTGKYSYQWTAGDIVGGRYDHRNYRHYISLEEALEQEGKHEIPE
jgi:hypothetical protein